MNKELSVIIPCRNEVGYIRECLQSLLDNDYPRDKMEIIVIDGMSDDGTRSIVNEYVADYSFIRMVDNPAKTKPEALNIGIDEARSAIWMRIDAHAVYAKDYISLCVKGLKEKNVDNIGGVRYTRSKSKTCIGLGLAEAVSHPFAVGNAYYRTGSSKPKYVDTVFCGCYRREVFDKIGKFNLKLLRTQDREFNTRLLENGGKILLDPAIKCYYYARTNSTDYLNWIYYGALWLFKAKQYTEYSMLSWRNFVPTFFTLALTISLIAMFFSPAAIVLLAIVILPYSLFAIYFSFLLAYKHKRFPLIFAMPFIFFSTHITYGLGALSGFTLNLGSKIRRRK